MKTEQQQRILAVTQMEEIGFISEGIESSVSGHIISEDGLTNIAEALEAGEAAQARVTELEEQLNTASAGNTEIQSQLDTANETINANNTRIQQLEEEVAALQAQEGITQTRKKSDDGGSKSKLPAHADPSAASNALADKLMGAPQSQEQ